MILSSNVEDELDLPESFSTLEVGRILGKTVPPGSLVLLSGPMGAGKTSLPKGLALGLGISETIVSPTFLYLQNYEGRKNGARADFLHADWDRVSGYTEELEEALLEGAEDRVTLVEWGEKISTSIRTSFSSILHVTISFHGNGRRLIFSWASQGGNKAPGWRDSFLSGMTASSGIGPLPVGRQPVRLA
jgi:tRNA threonylcarbamoyladenosine biosynthesis protein TsaE